MLEVSERVSCDYQLCMRSCTIKGLSMPMRIVEYVPSIIACVHVISTVSDFPRINRTWNESGFIHSHVGIVQWRQASSGGDLEIRSELHCV